MIAPPLRHRDPLVPMRPAMIGRAHLVAIAVRQRAFDRVGVPFPAFVEQGRSHRAKAVRGHFIAGIAKPTQSPVERVFAHRPSPRADGRKNIARRPGRLVNLPKNRHRLPRQRHMMWLAHFGATGRDGPDCGVQIDLAPIRMTKFAGANENMRGELQGKFCYAAAIIVVDCTEQLANPLRVGDCAVCVTVGEVSAPRKSRVGSDVSRAVAMA